VVTWLKRCDARSAFHNNTSAFVSTNKWEKVVNTHHRKKFFRWNHVASDEVLVGVAHAGHFPIHQYLVGLWFVYFNFFNHPWLINPVKNGCT